MTVGRKLKRNIFIDTDIDCQNCGCWQRVCTWNGECDNLEPMTNEEWFDTLPMEEKAEFLSKIEEQYPCGPLLKCDVTCGYHSQCRGDDVAPTNKEAWVEWLKQPHKPIS